MTLALSEYQITNVDKQKNRKQQSSKAQKMQKTEPNKKDTEEHKKKSPFFFLKAMLKIQSIFQIEGGVVAEKDPSHFVPDSF